MSLGAHGQVPLFASPSTLISTWPTQSFPALATALPRIADIEDDSIDFVDLYDTPFVATDLDLDLDSYACKKTSVLEFIRWSWWHTTESVSSAISFLSHHFRQPRPAASQSYEFIRGGNSDPTAWQEGDQELYHIPQYVLDYAPLVHLFSGESFWPCDMAEHLRHVRPYANYDAVGREERYNMTDLDLLNDLHRQVFLTSDDNVEERPDWLWGKTNIPEEPEPDQGKGKGNHTEGGRSDAPVVMLVVDKGHGVVDAFYHFFYCYNLGNKVLKVRFGNHVGDWEHMVVRFKHGKPKEVFFSQHIFGQAYTYDAVEKIRKRPVGYSATGTHAMYPTPGIHRYVLPWGLLHDETDRGPLWDPLQNAHAFNYNMTSGLLQRTTMSPESPTAWFYYTGRWGDKAYRLNDKRQYYFAGQYHYVNGPSGPIRKNLGRKDVCINLKCEVKKQLDAAGTLRLWPTGEEIGELEAARIVGEFDDLGR